MSVARLLTLLLLVGTPSRTWSQTVPDLPDRYRSDVAGDRPQPVFDPLGVRLGSFIARADGDFDVGYDSNLFGRATNIVGDAYTRITPSLQLNSDWGRDAVELGAAATITRFASLSSQNTNEYRAHAGGMVEIGDRITLRPNVDITREAVPRGSVGNRFTIGDPLYLRRYSTNVAARYSGGLFSAEMLVAYRRERFEPIEVDGVLLPQRLRDTNGLGGRLSLLYEVTPAISGLVQVVAEKSDNPYPELCCLRNAHGYAFLGGMRLDPRGLIAGQVAIGYRRRIFEGTGTTSNGLTYDARLQWYPTELVTVDFKANQQFRNSGITAANSVLVSQQTLSVAYEMYRDLNFNLAVGREAADYRQAQTRTNLKSISIRATYTSRRLLQLSAFARYQKSDTSRPALASQYDGLRAGMSVRTRI